MAKANAKQKDVKGIESFTFEGTITGTSNKQNVDFVSENPRKSVYITVDDKNREILLGAGMTEYTSEKDKQNFFIIKASEEITIWLGDTQYNLSADIISPNFKSTEVVKIACVKGFNKGNNYIRIYALGTSSSDSIELIEKENPFL